MKRMASVLLFLACASPALAETTYLCVPEKAVGFHFEKALQEWEPTTFKVAEKYVIMQPTLEDAVKDVQWVVKRVSNKGQVVAYCEHDFNDLGHLNCDLVAQFKFNRNTMRFLVIYSNGYWDDVPANAKLPGKDQRLKELYREGANVPYFEIGQCAPMEL